MRSIAVGCSGGESRPDAGCSPPPTTTYSGEPLPTNARGCVGGPKYTGYVDREMHQDDPELTFLVGCTARIPECSKFYPEYPRSFTCDVPPPNGLPVWLEPV